MSSPEYLKNRRDVLYTPFNGNGKTLIIFFSVSLLVHGLFFYGIIFFQEFKLLKPVLPSIQVDLVSFLPEPVVEESAGKQDKEIFKDEGIPANPLPKPSPPKDRKIATIKPDISLKTKPDNLKDLMAKQAKKKKASDKQKTKKPVVKPKTQKSIDKALETARETLEKKIENQNQNKIAQALSRLQKKVKGQGKAKKGQGQGAAAGVGKKGYTPIDLYKMVLGSAIEQNWVFNDILARLDQKLEARILIKILKSGEIRDIIYETRSGNLYLDESAKKAIKKTNPLPPLPSGMHSYDVVVIFTPKGLK